MKLAIFDFDGTLFERDTMPFMLTQWKKLGYSKKKLFRIYIPLIPLYAAYKLGVNSKLTQDEMRIKAIHIFNQLFKNMKEEEIHEYFSKVAKKILPHLNKPIVEEVERAKQEGYHTVLLSGAYQILLDKIGKKLEIDTVIGTRIYFTKRIFDMERPTDIISGSQKIIKMREVFRSQSIDWAQSTAYADSCGDISLLEAVGHPVAVNPDSRLSTYAKAHKWRIIQ